MLKLIKKGSSLPYPQQTLKCSLVGSSQRGPQGLSLSSQQKPLFYSLSPPLQALPPQLSSGSLRHFSSEDRSNEELEKAKENIEEQPKEQATQQPSEQASKQENQVPAQNETLKANEPTEGQQYANQKLSKPLNRGLKRSTKDASLSSVKDDSEYNPNNRFEQKNEGTSSRNNSEDKMDNNNQTSDIWIDEQTQSMMLDDQKGLYQMQRDTGSQALNLLEKDIKNIQSYFEEQINQEKQAYVDKLDVLKQLAENNQVRRVFCEVEELEEANKLHQSFLAKQLKRKQGHLIQANEPKEAQQFDYEISRKEAHVVILNLQQTYELDNLKNLTDKFENLSEQEQRDTFKSLKIGQAKSLARIELLKIEQDSMAHQNIAELQQLSQVYGNLLKQILPKDFLGEYPSLDLIEKQKSDTEKHFEIAIEQFRNQSNKLIDQQQKLKDYKDLMLEYQNEQNVAKFAKMNSKDLLSPDDFKNKLERIKEMQQILQESEVIEKEFTNNSEQQLQAEKQNQSFQLDAEYDLVQQKNLLQMVLNQKEDVAKKLKQMQYESASRWDEAFRKDTSPNETVYLNANEIFQETSPNNRRQELLNLMQKYKVDPKWLSKQKSKQLQQFINQQNQKLYQKAKDFEQNLLMREFSGLSKLMEKHASSSELRSYLLSKLKIGSLDLIGKDKYIESDQYLNDALISMMQDKLTDTTQQTGFDLTQYLMKKISNKEFESKKPKRPINTVFDQKQKDKWQASNPVDQNENQNEILTYKQYRHRQIYKLQELAAIEQEASQSILESQTDYQEQYHDKYGGYSNNNYQDDNNQIEDYVDFSLFGQMTLGKRIAWNIIYNQYLNSQFQNNNQSVNSLEPLDIVHELKDQQDLINSKKYKSFLESFRNWQQIANAEGMPPHIRQIILADNHVAYTTEQKIELMKELEWLKNHEWRSEIGGKYVRNDRIITDLITETPREIVSHQAYLQIAFNEDLLVKMKEKILVDSGAKNLFDEEKINKVEQDKYETKLQELIQAKELFKELSGVDFGNYIPVNKEDLETIKIEGQASSNSLHIAQFTAFNNQVKLDRSFVAQKKLQAYKVQYPEDTDIDFIKLEKIELEPKIQLEVDEWLFKQRLQEKYHRYLQTEKLIKAGYHQSNGLKIGIKINDLLNVMDDFTVSTIQNYLNENHHRDIKISQEYSEDPEFEDQIGKQWFDLSEQQHLEDSKLEWKGDFARQQDIIFQMKHKETKIEQNMWVSNRINEFNKIEQYESDIRKKKLTELKDWKEQDNQLKEQLKANQQIIAQIIKQIAQGDDKLRHLMLREINSPNKKFRNLKDDDPKTLEQKIKLHKQILSQQKQIGTDPISILEKEIKNKQANQQNYPDQTDFLYENQIFKPKHSNPEVDYVQQINQIDEGSKSPRSTKQLFQEILSLSEDTIIQQMVQDGQIFDLKTINDQLPINEINYIGARDQAPSNINEHQWARSADQIINQAQSQQNSATEQQLAMVYNPNNPVRELYLRTKYQMHVNHQLRQQLALKILQAKQYFGGLTETRDFFQVNLDETLKNYHGAVIPTKVLDLIETDTTLDEPTEVTVSQMIQSIKQFDPKSQDIVNYNKELALHANKLRQIQARISETKSKETLAKLENQKHDVLMQHDFIVKLIHQNGVRPDFTTHCLVFESNVSKDNLQMANENLKIMLNSSQYRDPTLNVPNCVFHTFFCNSISQDNFDGLAYLINYVEKEQIDTSKWQMDRFRSGLDFYLNHAFNISKVLTFTRFYVNHVESNLNKVLPIEEIQSLSSMSEEELALLHNQVFGKVEDLVDIHQLFGHLVDRIGQKQLIDPISKQDPIMCLINLYSDPRILHFSKLSVEGTTSISEDDMAKYIVNKLNQPNSFKMFEQNILKHMDNEYFIGRLINKLRQTRVKHQGTLPESLSSTNVKQLYLKVKALVTATDNQSHSQTIAISEKTAELFLFLFRANNMVPEAVDLCQNFEKLVKNAETKQSDIRNYHMSDALLQVELAENSQSDHHYYSLIDKAVFTEESHKESAAYLISMTKAYLKDGNVDHAIKFFNEGLQKRKQIKQKQDDILVKMFNSTFDLDTQSQGESITLQDFKYKLYNLVAARQRMKREASMIKMLQDILNRCDPEEIDHVFNYQAVLREERLLLLSLSAADPVDYGTLYDAYNRIGVDSQNIQQFVSDHLSQQKLNLKKQIKYLREFQIDALDEALDSYYQSNGADIKNSSKKLDKAEFETMYFDDELNQMSDQQKDSLRQNFVAQLTNRLFTVKSRREALEKKLSYENINQIQDLMISAQDETVTLMDHVEDLPQTIIDLGFPQESYQNLRQYKKEQINIENVIQIMKNETDQGRLHNQEKIYGEFIQKFKQIVKESTDEAVNQANQQIKSVPISLFQKFDAQNNNFKEEKLQDMVDEMFEKDEDNQWPQFDQDQQMLKMYDRFLYEDPIDGTAEDEELVIRQQVYDQAVQQHYEELKQVVHSRQKRSLPEAINIFNKIQNKQLPLWMRPEGELNTKRVSSLESSNNQLSYSQQNSILDSFNQTTYDFEGDTGYNYHQYHKDHDASNNDQHDDIQKYQVVDETKINQTIQRYKYLLEDSTSPFISNFISLLDYEDGRDLMDIQQFHNQYSSINSSKPDHIKQKHPLRVYINQSQKLMTLIDELDKIVQGSIEMRYIIFQKQQEVKETFEGAQKYKDWYLNKKNQGLKKLIDQNVKQVYKQFIKDQNQDISIEVQESSSSQQPIPQDSLFLPKTMSKQSIIDMTQQLQIAGFKQYEVLSSFYAEDLIAFGIDNDIPVAVRLGEKVFSESNKQIPTPLATAIKNYKMSHRDSYHAAMKQTGPIDTAKAYRSHTLNTWGGYQKHSTTSIISRDDPYWQENQERNYAAVDQFRLPSALAWDHKQDGLFGEIFDLKKLRKDAEIINSKY